MSQTEVDVFCVLHNIISIITDYYMFITHLPKANFGPLTRKQPHLPNSVLMGYPSVSLSLVCSALGFHMEWYVLSRFVTLPILFCLRFSCGMVVVRRNSSEKI